MIDNKNIRKLLKMITETYEAKKQELSKYDSYVGDGDHGFSLARGCIKANSIVSSLPNDCNLQECLKLYGRALTAEIGGAMGPLFGMLFTELGRACMNSSSLGLTELSNGISTACYKIMELGGAKVGDKTMVDAIFPVVNSLDISEKKGEEITLALDKALKAAEEGVKSTILIQAKKGRAKYLMEKSIGYQDAGATSFYYFIKTIRDFFYLEE